MALLVSAGVDIDRGAGSVTGMLDPETLFDTAPDDPRGALPDGPSFTIDDVIEFHFMLEDERVHPGVPRQAVRSGSAGSIPACPPGSSSGSS